MAKQITRKYTTPQNKHNTKYIINTQNIRINIKYKQYINIKTKLKLKLSKWNMIYNHETKNTILWQKYQIDQFYRTKTWHNHQILKSKIQCYTNNNPIQVTINEDIEYKIKIKIKCLRITYQIQYTKTYYYSFDNSLILLRSGDIEVNLGPMPNILETHPPPHK